MGHHKSRKTTVRSIELVAIIVIVCVAVVLVLPLFRDNRALVAHRSCTGNLKQWGAIFMMYARENNWEYPIVHGIESFGPAESLPACANIHEDFDWCPDLRRVFPEYATDLGLLVCPDGPYLNPKGGDSSDTTGKWRVDEEALGVVKRAGWKACEHEGTITNGDVAYTYLGWRINRAEDDDPYVDATTAKSLGLPAAGPAQIVALLWHVDPDRPEPDPNNRRIHPVPGGRRFEHVDVMLLLDGLGPPYTILGSEADDGVVARLAKGWGYFEGTAAAAAGSDPPVRPWHEKTAVMWDTVSKSPGGTPEFAHRDPEGANVLFFDGHVEFVPYPGKFPMSKNYVSLEYVK